MLAMFAQFFHHLWTHISVRFTHITHERKSPKSLHKTDFNWDSKLPDLMSKSFTLLPMSQCFCFCCLLEFRIKFDVIYWYEFFARDTIIRNSRKWNFINDGKNSTDWSTHFLWTLDTNLKTLAGINKDRNSLDCKQFGYPWKDLIKSASLNCWNVYRTNI